MAQIKNGDAGNDKNKQRDRTLQILSNPPSVVIGTIDDNMSDVRAAQIVAIFGTLWMVLVGLQMLNGTPLGRGSAALAEIAFSASISGS
jgi:hypothetical protein